MEIRYHLIFMDILYLCRKLSDGIMINRIEINLTAPPFASLNTYVCNGNVSIYIKDYWGNDKSRQATDNRQAFPTSYITIFGLSVIITFILTSHVCTVYTCYYIRIDKNPQLVSRLINL